MVENLIGERALHLLQIAERVAEVEGSPAPTPVNHVAHQPAFVDADDARRAVHVRERLVVLIRRHVVCAEHDHRRFGFLRDLDRRRARRHGRDRQAQALIGQLALVGRDDGQAGHVQ